MLTIQKPVHEWLVNKRERYRRTALTSNYTPKRKAKRCEAITPELLRNHPAETAVRVLPRDVASKPDQENL